MIDFVLGAVLVALFVRGWLRGFVREAIGLGVVVVGTILAFRLSTPVGGFVAGFAGTSPDVSRLIGGALVFLGISTAAAIVGVILHRGIRILPGLPTVNRVGGAVLAAGGGAIVATVVLSVLTVAPVPEALAAELDESRFASTLTDPEGIPQQALGVASGDHIMSVVLRLEGIVGTPHVGDPGPNTVFLNVDADADIKLQRDASEGLVELVNTARVEADVAPLAPSAALDAVAAAHAKTMYRDGWVAHTSPEGTTPSDRLDAAGIPYVTQVELIGLAASEETTVASWQADEATARRLSNTRQRKIGVAVVSGPLGRLAVVVMTG